MASFATGNGLEPQIVGTRGSAVETARGRLVFMALMFVLAYGALGMRVTWLSLLQEGSEPRFESVAAGQENAAILAAGRGDIVDRNGVLLATTLETISLFADPKVITDPQMVARDLQKIFPQIDEATLIKRLSGKGRFVWIERGVTPDAMKAVNALGHPGLDFRFEKKRFYPQENLTSHIVGYTGVDGDGFAGTELSFDEKLKNNAKPLALTIDVRFQHALRRAIETQMNKFSAIGGTGVIMDVGTGEVLAAVSLPDFNPQKLNEATDDQKFNRFALGLYEMGSTFKTFSTAALLDRVNPDLGQKFDARNSIKRGKFTISDFHAKKTVMTVPETFMHSSNIGTALMSEKIGTPLLKQFYMDLGFGAPVPVSLPERAAPIVPRPWRDINTITASYGHGISVTPLHLMRAFAAIVNGGTLPAVHIVKGAHDETRTRIVSSETSQTMLRLLRLVVTHGTGEKADFEGAMVAGKTGTSEKNINGRYVKTKLVSSFIGAFPADKPRYAVLVSVDEPKGTKESYGYATAGWVAAPAISDIVKNIVSLENLPKADASHDEAIEAQMLQYLPAEEKEKKAKVRQASFER